MFLIKIQYCEAITEVLIADPEVSGYISQYNSLSNILFCWDQRTVRSVVLSNSNKTNECFTTFVLNTETFPNVNIFLSILLSIQ